MNLLDLFSGIGGFSLGLHQAGFRTVAFCEQDSYCQAVLSERFPGVPIYDDIRTLTAERLRADGIRVEALAGGFPCQDLSFAGKRAGIEGARSGLWGEYARLIRELRPRLVFVENVPGLLSAGMGRVLGDLAALGYDAEWDCIPASAVGAPHRRDRVWILAQSQNAIGDRLGAVASRQQDRPTDSGEIVAHADNAGLEGRCSPKRSDQRKDGQIGARDFQPHVSNSISGRRPGQGLHEDASHPAQGCAGETTELVNGSRPEQRGAERGLGRVAHGVSDWVDSSAWMEEPEGVPRVIKGQENRAARLKALGNSIVPQIPAMLGRAFMKALQP